MDRNAEGVCTLSRPTLIPLERTLAQQVHSADAAEYGTVEKKSSEQDMAQTVEVKKQMLALLTRLETPTFSELSTSGYGKSN